MLTRLGLYGVVAPAESLTRFRAAGRDPATKAEANDEAAHVAAALATLPAEQREVVVLRVYGRLKFREIAETLALSINTVQSRHRYALSALKTKLTGAKR